MATDSAVVSFPTEEELEKTELALHEAIEETLNDLAWRIHHLLNRGATAPAFEDIGRLVFWVGMFEMHLRTAEKTVAALRESIDDLAQWKHSGETHCEPAYNEYGSRQRFTREEEWRNEISRQLGIEKFTGGWHPADAKRIAAAWKKKDEEAT